ncbi:MAG: F0F1 ATP synthase subunit A, partial [Actinomyces sp.]|nr:F0F1 ATP synthase subunit A [Actinomyces sp.]
MKQTGALLTGAGAVAATLFEIFVAVLQAYIFAMLTAVYIKLSVEEH